MFFILEDSDKSESRIVIPTKMVFKSMYLHKREKIWQYWVLLLLTNNLAVSIQSGTYSLAILCWFYVIQLECHEVLL